MRWLAWLRLLALVVWLPATSHCRLASLPALSFLACGHSDDGTSNETHHADDGDGCASVESASYRSEDRFDLPAPLPLQVRPDLLGTPFAETVCLAPDIETPPAPDPNPPPRGSVTDALRSVGAPRAPSDLA
ncbi:MAG: hypothetical protein JNL97_05795 [Verrucomicrobiales bacterium]|nr:hypothetical protein [Verrucomicrobiales bacterium]